MTEKSAAVKKFGTLGPKGARKNGGKKNNGSTSPPDYSGRTVGGGLEGKVGGLAAFFREEQKMKHEGYGLFPAGFDPPNFLSKKTFHFVEQGSVITCNYFKLAEAVKYSSPFTFADSQPLTRYNRIQKF